MTKYKVLEAWCSKFEKTWWHEKETVSQYHVVKEYCSQNSSHLKMSGDPVQTELYCRVRASLEFAHKALKCAETSGTFCSSAYPDRTFILNYNAWIMTHSALTAEVMLMREIISSLRNTSSKEMLYFLNIFQTFGARHASEEYLERKRKHIWFFFFFFGNDAYSILLILEES